MNRLSFIMNFSTPKISTRDYIPNKMALLRLVRTKEILISLLLELLEDEIRQLMSSKKRKR